MDFRIADLKSKRNFGLGHRLVQIVGADSISAPEQNRADMESAPTQYVAERMTKAEIFIKQFAFRISIVATS